MVISRVLYEYTSRLSGKCYGSSNIVVAVVVLTVEALVASEKRKVVAAATVVRVAIVETRE